MTIVSGFQTCLDEGEVKSRQAELEAKLKELQTRLDAKGEAPPTLISETRRANASATQIEERPAQTLDLSGTWSPPADDPSFYTIEQNGNSLVIQQSLPNLGVLAAGQGQLSGRNLTISYTTVLGTTGRGNATVSADGSQITGQVTDLTTGVTSPLIISR